MWALYVPGSDTSRIFYGTDTRCCAAARRRAVGVRLEAVGHAGLVGLRARRILDAVSLVALAAVIYEFAAVHDYDQGLYRGGFSSSRYAPL